MSRFPDDAQALPLPVDRRQVELGRERWHEAAAAAGPDVGVAARRLDQGRARPLLDAVFAYSPYLTSLMVLEPAFALRLLEEGPDAAYQQTMADSEHLLAASAAGASPAADLRRGKRRIALITGLADIAGWWPLEQVTAALSRFAEAALDCAAAFLIGDALRRGLLVAEAPPAEGELPLRHSGLIILGLGKLGAGELNYSSDIDLIVLYDLERVRLGEGADPQPLFNRLTRQLVRLMAERTAEGYVFRTDLRLRPDPASTPLAISVLAAETYYETLGQNWERAALIKARPVAGDIAAGQAFLQRIQPFIWRKNLDFAAIQDIHSIKRQINAHRGGSRIALAGHNIKLGRGGIREIEFFAQTQQLIWGGRLPALRCAPTVEALQALAAAGKIDGRTATALSEAYRFLRQVEHRLQIIDDEQTHTLPKDPAKLAAFAAFLGYPSAEAFAEAMLAVLRRVETHYVELFEDAPALTLGNGEAGNLVFTGGEPDPETLSTLARLGFAHPEVVDSVVRGWHHGRCRAMRSTRARELLTELMPHLLRAFSAKPDPDAAFLAFDAFLSALPAGVQLFSMFYAHPDLLKLLTEILGVAPRLGSELARRPSLFDSVLSPDFFAPPPPREALEDELKDMLARARTIEEVLDASRRFAGERRFQIGVQSILGLIDPAAAAVAYSNVAEAAIAQLKPVVEAEFARRHGRITGEGLAVVAMGKLGGREMTARSDLDLIFVYDAPSPAAVSDGARPLAAAQYYARLSQRLINALTAPTAEGQLYAVDMRLRPSGNAGPIATSLASFRRYHRQEAWTWEQMALTRARVIAGPPRLCEAIEEAIFEVLTSPRDPDQLVIDVAVMRERMERELAASSPWDVKHLRGGLVDVEFIAQYLQLRHAHERPEVLSPTTAEALAALGASGVLPAPEVEALLAALSLWQALQQRLRLTLDELPAGKGEEERPRLLREALAGVAGLEFDQLRLHMDRHARAVREIFHRVIEQPATAARQRLLSRGVPAVSPQAEMRR